MRTLKTDLETKVKSHLLTSMAVWPWLVGHSAWLVERYQMRANGRTSNQDCFGTICAGILLRFVEQAIFRHPVGTAAGRNRQTFKQLRKEKAANRMDLGIWLGKTYETDEHFMGTSDGIFTARTCRRMPSDGQWKLDAKKAVTGVPWNMGAGRLIGRPRHARVQVLHRQTAWSEETASPRLQSSKVFDHITTAPDLWSFLVNPTELENTPSFLQSFQPWYHIIESELLHLFQLLQTTPTSALFKLKVSSCDVITTATTVRPNAPKPARFRQADTSGDGLLFQSPSVLWKDTSKPREIPIAVLVVAKETSKR